MRRLGIALVVAGAAAAFAPAQAPAADICVTTFEEFGKTCTKDAGRIATCVALAETAAQTIGCLPNPYGIESP